MQTFYQAGVLASAVAFTVFGTAPALAGDAPQFQAVGPVDFQVTDMTPDGQVIVGSFLFGAPSFRWTREDGGVIIGGNGGLVRVSNDGAAISGNLIVDGHNEAARWLGGSDWEALGGLSDSGCPDFSNNYGLSGDGQVIVGLGWDGCQARAFSWREGTGMVDLGSMIVGRSSRANAANDDGSVIVGWDDAEDGSRRGARWVNGVESLLADNTDPGLFLGEAQAVTGDGSVIVGGPAGPALGRWQYGYIWTEETGGKLIGSLGSGNLWGTFAFAVSEDGTVAGGASGEQSRDAFIWTAATGTFHFQDYLAKLGVEGLDGWQLDTILAMSADASSIAGWGINSFGRVQGWLVDNLPPFVDSDGDHTLDGIDNCSAHPNPRQRDTNGDGYGNRCDPDLNGDLVVDTADADLMGAVFMTADEDADLNGDGIVNAIDFNILKSFRFQAPGPSGLAP